MGQCSEFSLTPNLEYLLQILVSDNIWGKFLLVNLQGYNLKSGGLYFEKFFPFKNFQMDFLFSHNRRFIKSALRWDRV